MRSIEFWRFIFTIGIALGHTVGGTVLDDGTIIFSSGTNGIDFFFMLSGFLLVDSSRRMNLENSNILMNTFLYAKKRICRFLPLTWLALIITICVRIRMYILYRNYNLADVFIWLKGVRPEWYLINSIFYVDDCANGPTWYISAIIIVGIILFFVLAFFDMIKKPKLLYMCIGIIAFIAYRDTWIIGKIFLINSFISRAFVGMTLGVLIHGMVELFNTEQLAKFVQKCGGGIFCYGNYCRCRYSTSFMVR